MKYNSDFKYDLDLGLLGEKLVVDILTNKKVEVKTDYKSSETGNVFIEYSSRGKDSGITISKAEFYCFVTSNENITFIEIKKLKKLCRKYLNTNRDVKGGDNNTSQGILLPLKEII
jgi:hypothetical protein|tara:strand:+ start:1223 stop:1570 length:348 start_codon:yes stop_codon:yes gene_type:complete